MTYQVRVSPAARKQLRRIDVATQQRIVTTFTTLGADPRPPGYRALKAQDLYRTVWVTTACSTPSTTMFSKYSS
jgi:mRNA-degrading endonuclease RelE of RelBE toxin-antitoxin system